MTSKKIKADLHNHLRTPSRMHDGDFNKAVDLAREGLGEGAVFALVNFNDERFEEFSKLPGYERTHYENAVFIPEKQILVIRGQEVPTKGGHLLVLATNKGTNLEGGKSLEETINEAHKNNGLVIADHPFYIGGCGKKLNDNPDLLKELDGFEIHNGEAILPIPKFLRANKKARRFYDRACENDPSLKNSLSAVVDSDGHSFYELGSSWMEIDELDLTSEDSIRESLRLGMLNSTKNKKTGSYRGVVEHGLRLSYHMLTHNKVAKTASRLGEGFIKGLYGVGKALSTPYQAVRDFLRKARR